MQEAFDQARSCYEQAKALASEHHLGVVLARTYRALAVLECGRAIARSPETDAIVLELLDRSLQCAQEVEDWQEKLRTLGEMSNILSAPEPARSRRLALQCVEMARALMLPHYLSPTLAILTRLALAQARAREARVHLDAARLAARDAGGDNLTLTFSEALVCLHENDIEQVDALLVELRKLNEQGSAHLASQVEKLELLASIASSRRERFWALCHEERDITSFHRALLALGEAIFSEGDAHERAIAALVRATQALDHQHHDGFSAVFWGMALKVFPHQLLPLYQEPALVVNVEEGWFMKVDTGCVELSHRPYLKRFLGALVTRHGSVEGSGFGTLDLFHIGWPETSIQTSAMKNRVYVGVSVLRDLGLREWLLNDSDGYRLDRSITVFMSTASAHNG